MITFFIGVFLVYYVSVLALAFGWARLADKQRKQSHQQDHFLSVVIAFRNEATNLPALLVNLREQSYSQEKFEVIFVDDHSDDQSPEIVKASESSSSIRLMQLPQHLTGKKAALDFGIRQAKGEVIVTTDADCRVMPQWLSFINEQFQNEKIKMVTGLVRIDESNSLFSRLQALEFVSLMGTTGATIGLGSPTMCNGANLSFRKSAYLQVNGYEGNATIPSGDDEFLMRKINSTWKNAIAFLDDEQSIVFTPAQHSFSQWINQRLRWASKWKYNSPGFSKAVALIVLSFHMGFTIFFALTFTGQFTMKQFTLLWGTKMLVEALFLIPVCSTVKLRWRWISFFVLQFTYSFYVVAIGIFSQVKGYEWKGRRWDPKRA